MSSFRIVPLGVGDAFSALHYSSSLAVQSGDSWLLIDCPHPIQKMIREANIDGLTPDRVSAVVLTHLHADHASGLEGLAYFTYFYFQRRLPLLIHPVVAARLWEGHLAAGMEALLPEVGAAPIHRSLEDYFELHPLSEDVPTRFGPFEIECRRTIHHVPTTALRVRAEGRCLGHSADTAFDPTLIDWLSSANLIVHETNYGVHTPYEKLAALPADLRRRMRLNHYPDAFDLEGSVIEPLKQGVSYAV